MFDISWKCNEPWHTTKLEYFHLAPFPSDALTLLVFAKCLCLLWTPAMGVSTPVACPQLCSLKKFKIQNSKSMGGKKPSAAHI
jgi:hypothetical protein